MAEFALGLTKTAVEGALSRVKLVIEEEAELNEQVRDDLVFITGEFEMMQAFLKVANSERVKNEVVRIWVRQLRTLAFDVEDCVEFIVHPDKKSTWGWLPRLRHMVYCRAPRLPLDMAISEIKLLKARVEDVSQRNMRYNLIMDSSSTSKPSSSMEQPIQATTCASALRILREVWEAMGQWRSKGDLQKLVNGEGNDLQVISIWDSRGGDLGTRCILSKMYNDQAICQEFESRAWVKLNHPFNPDECLKSMLTQFCTSSHQRNIDAVFRTRMKAAVDMEDELMKAQLMREVMKGHKYIVIFEDVPSVVEWDVIKMYLPDYDNGSRIILSTKQLGVAVLCTGKPYQVSELRQFSHDQSLCAFSKKYGRHSGIGELMWQLRCRGVIAVYGSTYRKSTLVNKVYTRIVHKSKQFEGVEFERHSWIDAPVPFNLEVFSQRLLLSLRLENLVTEEIKAVGMLRGPCLTQECSNLLHEYDCLVIINGLQSTHDWNSIKTGLLFKPTKGCILVITNEERVATHCAEEEGVLSMEDMEADPMLRPMLKGSEYYGSGGTEAFDRGRRFCVRKEQAREWLRKFRSVHQDETSEQLETLIKNPGVVSVWGIAGAGKSTLVRTAYLKKMVHCEHSVESGYDEQTIHVEEQKAVMFSWVDVSHPFNLTDFPCHLFLDFHSDDSQSKKAAAVSMMEGQDPIQGCCKFLCENQCFVVIDGLRSTHDWDLIKDAFLSNPIKCSIVVITQEATVATYCVNHEEERVMMVRSTEFDRALGTPIKIARSTRDFNAGCMEILKLIVAKCGRIPRIIATIAKEIAGDGNLLAGLNRDFMGEVETNAKFHSLRGLFSWIQSYFDACPDSLKPCIFYLSVFPAGHKIKRRRLLRRWIAECYSRDTSSSTAEENGQKLIYELVHLSIVLYDIRAGIVECQVNGFSHEYIISRPMEDNLVFALEGNCSLNSERAGHHLTISSSWDRDIKVFTSMDLSRLRSLTVFGKWMPFFISTDMRLLRVLDLTDTSHLTNDDLEQIGKVMPRLKFLSVRGCGDITRLPESLCELSQLQTLDVRHTSVVMLPLAIIKLKKLQYVRAGTTISSDEYDDTGMTVVPLSDVEQTMEDSDGTASDVEETSTPLEDTDDTASEIEQTTTLPAQAVDVQTSAPSGSSMPGSLVSSWLYKLCHTRQHDNGGVKVPSGIGKMTALHTLGVVDLNVKGGKAILKELTKLTQLRKLGVSGINRGNSHDLCSAISGHAHLESLSVRLDKDKEGVFFCLNDITQLPKTLKSLKLYGDTQILPTISWVMHHKNLYKGNLQMDVMTQEDINVFETLRCGDIFQRLRFKPIQDVILQFDKPENVYMHPGISLIGFRVRVIEIDCTSRLEINFRGWLHIHAELLIVRCSGARSFLRVYGLLHLRGLKEVWLKGSYGDELKQDLQRQINMFKEKPVLKLQERRSS